MLVQGSGRAAGGEAFAEKASKLPMQTWVAEWMEVRVMVASTSSGDRGTAPDGVV